MAIKRVHIVLGYAPGKEDPTVLYAGADGTKAAAALEGASGKGLSEVRAYKNPPHTVKKSLSLKVAPEPEPEPEPAKGRKAPAIDRE